MPCVLDRETANSARNLPKCLPVGRVMLYNSYNPCVFHSSRPDFKRRTPPPSIPSFCPREQRAAGRRPAAKPILATTRSSNHRSLIRFFGTAKSVINVKADRDARFSNNIRRSPIQSRGDSYETGRNSRSPELTPGVASN